MTIEAVLFDRDNTLFDTEHTLHQAYQDTLNQFGIPRFLYSWVDHHTSGATTTLERCLWLKERFEIHTSAQVLASVYKEYYLAMFDAQPIQLMEGARELLDKNTTPASRGEPRGKCVIDPSTHFVRSG